MDVIRFRTSREQATNNGTRRDLHLRPLLAQALYHVEAAVAQQSTLWEYCESGFGSGSVIRVNGPEFPLRDVASMGPTKPNGVCATSDVDARRLAGYFSIDLPGVFSLSLVKGSGDFALTLAY